MKIEPDLDEIEDAYRQAYLPADRVLISYAAIPWIVFTLFFIYSDALFFRGSQLFVILLMTRILYALLTIGMLVCLRRFARPQLYDRLILAWCILTVAHMSWIEFARPSTYTGHYTLDVLVIMVLYLIPNRFLFRALVAVLFSSFVLIDLFVYKYAIQPAERNAIVVACLVANIIGLAISTRLFTYRRQQFKALREAQQATTALEILAATDALTGIFNRRKFIELGMHTFQHFARYHRAFSVHVIDLDFFKHVNDQFGHAGGDETLKQFTQLVLQHKRETDIFGRLGGEEFGLILPNTSVEAATVLAERLRTIVQDTLIRLATTQIAITLSSGVAIAHPEDSDFDTILNRADRLLYQAKHTGRNCVVVESWVEHKQ